MVSSSIIICTKDRHQDLGRCLDTILVQTRPPDEVLVVDGGADLAEGVVTTFRDRFVSGAVRYLRTQPGLTRQRNLGVEAASGDIVHFLDDDVLLDAAYVDEVQRVFEASDSGDVVAVSPMLEVNDALSSFSWFLRRVFLLPHIRGDGRLMPSGFASYPWNGDKHEVREIYIACGCCAYRRSVFEQLAFDEFFDDYGYMEDLDFAVRAARLGRILLAPRARMAHVESQTARMNERRLAAMQTINHYYFFRKNMPHDLVHWLAFWWSDVGDVLLKLVQVVLRGQVELLAGIIEGHRRFGDLRKRTSP